MDSCKTASSLVFFHICFIFLSIPFSLSYTGTKRERGIIAWNKAHEEDSSITIESDEVYGLPFNLSDRLSTKSWVRFIPFCPYHASRSPSEGAPEKSDSLDVLKEAAKKESTHIIASVGL